MLLRSLPLPLMCLLSASLLGCATSGGAKAPAGNAAADAAPYFTEADAASLSEVLWSSPETARIVTTAEEREQVETCMVSGIRAEVPTMAKARELGDTAVEAFGRSSGLACMTHFMGQVLSAETFGPSFSAVYANQCRINSPETPEACACLGERAASHFPSPRAFLNVEEALGNEAELTEEQASQLSSLSEACQITAAAED